MKKPPDVLNIESKPILPIWEYVPNKSVKQWFNLLEWAFNNNDTYLFNRASERLKALLV